jgi:hypothetical protein
MSLGKLRPTAEAVAAATLALRKSLRVTFVFMSAVLALRFWHRVGKVFVLVCPVVCVIRFVAKVVVHEVGRTDVLQSLHLPHRSFLLGQGFGLEYNNDPTRVLIGYINVQARASL